MQRFSMCPTGDGTYGGAQWSLRGIPGPTTRVVAYLFVLLVAAIWAVPTAQAETAKSVSQYGVTWVFDDFYEVGRYANGDWWVDGPVIITEIKPASTVVEGRVMHGTMINPGKKDSRFGPQGYDSFDGDIAYKASLNVDPGATGELLTVEEGSVVSSISKENPDDAGRPALDDLAILTVVDEPPPADAFRPGPYTEGKASRWAASDVDYGVVRSLPMLDEAPDLTTVIDNVERFWNEQHTGWEQRMVHADNNQAIYGREIAYELGEALLALQLDYSRENKRELLIHMVQRGIDIYDRADKGAVWRDNCGHNHGRKMPMLLAGLALDAEPILDMADADKRFIFQEDRQTFFVSEQDLNNAEHPTPYTEEDLGMPAWGCKYTAKNGDSANRDWDDASYRWVGSGYMYHALAAHVMESASDPTNSAAANWNYPAFFEYTDRYERKGGAVDPENDPTNGIQPFAQAFWDAYRDVGPGRGDHKAPAPPTLNDIEVSTP